MDKALIIKRVFQILKAIWVIMIITFIGLALYFVVPLILPFLMGWLIAYILNPIVNVLEKRAKFPRWLATSTSLLLSLSIASAILTLIVSKIVIEVARFSRMVSENIEFWVNDFMNYINSDNLQSIVNQIFSFYTQNEQYHNTIDQNINNIGDQLTAGVTALIGFTIEGAVYLVTSLPNFTFIIIIALLAAFFISKDWHSLLKWFFSFFPEKVKSS